MAPTPVCAPAKLLPGGCCTAGTALSPAVAPLSQLVRMQRHYTASSSHQRRAMARQSSPKLTVRQSLNTSPTTTTTPPPPPVPAATCDSAASRGASQRVPRIVNGAAAAAAAEAAVAAGGVAVDDGDSGSVRGAVVASGGGPLRHHSPVSAKLPASAPTPPTALCDISGQLNCSWSTGGGGGDAAVKKPHHHHTHLSNGQLDAASLLWLTENQFTTLSAAAAAAAAAAADGTNGIATAVANTALMIDGKKNGNICHRASDECLSQRSDDMHAIVDSYVRLSEQRPRPLSKFGADMIGDRCERSDWMAASGGDDKSAPDVSPIAAQHGATREVCGSDQYNGAALPPVTVESSGCGGAGDGPAGGGSTTAAAAAAAADSKRCAGELVDGAGDVEMRESLGEGGDCVYQQLDTGTVTTGSVSAECVLASQRVLRQRCGRLLRRLQLLQARAARQQYQCLVAGDHQQQPVAPLDCHSLLVARRQLLSLQRQLCPHDATDTSSSSDDSDSEPAGASLHHQHHHHQQQQRPRPAGYRDGDAVGDGGVTSRHSRAVLARHWASSVQHVTEIDSRMEQLRALYKRMRSARGSWLGANSGDGDLAQCSRTTAVAIVSPPVPTSESAGTTAAVGGRRRWRRLVRVSRVLGQSAASGCQRCSTGPIGGAFFGATGGGGGGGVSQYGLCSCSLPAAGSNTAADSSCLRQLADAGWRRQHLYPRLSVATAASSSSCCSSTTTVSLPDTAYRLHSHSAGYSSAAAAAAGSTAPLAAAPSDSSCHPGSARQSGHVTRVVRGASWDDAADSADDVLSISGGVGAGGDERRRGGGDGGSSGGRGGRHSSTTSTASSRRHSSSYDIDMVLPPGLAVTGRIERLQYKDISTPGWRLVSSCGAAAANRGSGCGGVGRLRSCPEDLSDAAFAGRHAVCQLAEQRRLYKRTIQRSQPLPPPPPQPLQTPQPSAYAPAVGAYTSLGSFSARHFPLSDADSRQLVAEYEEEEAEQMAPLFSRRRASSASGNLASAAACSSANDTFWPGLASEDGRSLSK